MTVLIGVSLGLALRGLATFVILPMVDAPRENPAFKHLQGNSSALPVAILMLGFVNAFSEELVMRGVFFERLTGLLGASKRALAAITIFTAAVFGIGHYPLQGLLGAEHAFVGGLIFAILYLRSGTLWLSIVTHGSYNLAGLYLIYFAIHAH